MMSKFTLQIDTDMMDEITRQNLQDAYRMSEDDETRNALDYVINYFSSEEQYAKWVKETKDGLGQN
jgi:hypothetical protein